MAKTVDLLCLFRCALGDEEQDDAYEEQVEDVDCQQGEPEEH